MGFLFVNVAYASVDSFVINLNKLIINPLILLLFALAVVYFLYGIVEFLSNQENEDKRSKGKSHMIWGIIGMTIMMGVFTIMKLILNTLNIDGINPEKGTVQLDNYPE
ncbi:MAG TPA: hypothetical protein PKZ36_02160 [Candidatus Paceibacterota bacterium]|nr:hypothetical protein [Candidatus Paceibacterota bacterium]HPT18187.1 hypothetical protein [Candidatus Paceibacterota bacterium]